MTNVRHFSIPELPQSKNIWLRLHWAKRGRIKAEWERWVWALVNEHPRMPRPLDSVTCHIVVMWAKPGPLPDFHNLEMAFEVIADGIVKAGIIRDDSGFQFQRGTMQVLRGEKAATTFTLMWD